MFRISAMRLHPLCRKDRSLLLATLALALTTTSRAQSPAPPADTTFHAETQEVLIDVAVADKKGDVPRDLTAGNFKILEDGKDQKLTSFSFTGNAAPGRTGKHFVALVFDYEETAFREQAIRFVDRFSSPDLYIAIYARADEDIHLVQAFTTDPVRLRTALRDMRIVGESSAIRWVKVDSPNVNRQLPEVSMLDRIDKVAAELKPVHGRKALVLFANGLISFRAGSAGGASPVDRQFLHTIDTCNKANVALYGFAIDASSGSAAGWYSGSRTATTTNRVRDLADRTGGKYGTPGGNELASYLGSIATEQDNYYVLGYVPSADSASNCHKLKVTLARKGLDIHARDTYCASGVPDSSLKAPQRALEALAQTGATGAVPVSMRATWFYLRSDTAVANVAMNIGPAAMQSKGNLRGEIPVLGVAYRADGSVAARFSDTVDLNFETQSELDDFRKTSYPYSNQLSLPPGSYRIRVVAGTAGKTFGSIEQPLEIPPWGGDMLSASAITLGDHDNPGDNATINLDPALIDGPYRLASQEREFVPMAATQFHLKQQALLYFEIYEPRLAASTAAHPVKPPVIDLSIVDRAKGEQKFDSGPMNTSQWTRPGSTRIPITTRFPSADLPAGMYTLELRVTHDDGQDEIVRTANFEVK